MRFDYLKSGMSLTTWTNTELTQITRSDSSNSLTSSTSNRCFLLDVNDLDLSLITSRYPWAAQILPNIEKRNKTQPPKSEKKAPELKLNPNPTLTAKNDQTVKHKKTKKSKKAKKETKKTSHNTGGDTFSTTYYTSDPAVRVKSAKGAKQNINPRFDTTTTADLRKIDPNLNQFVYQKLEKVNYKNYKPPPPIILKPSVQPLREDAFKIEHIPMPSDFNHLYSNLNKFPQTQMQAKCKGQQNKRQSSEFSPVNIGSEMTSNSNFYVPGIDLYGNKYETTGRAAAAAMATATAKTAAHTLPNQCPNYFCFNNSNLSNNGGQFNWVIIKFFLVIQ